MILQPRNYQQAIFETAKNHNTLVVLPTGLGKTLIALLLSQERLKQFPKSKVLMLAPTRPLVEQHLRSFSSQLQELSNIQLFTGSIDPEKRQKIWQTADIIFSTPQCIANDLENALYNLENVSLLIMDEAHRCLKNYDYTKVVSFYKTQSKNPRILGLTASPGSTQEKIKEICKHLDIEEVESRTRESSDVSPYLQSLEFEKIEVEFPKEFEEIRQLLKIIYNKKIEQLQNRSLLFGPINKITLLQLQQKLAAQASSRNFNALVGMSLTAQAIKIAHALELLETQTLSGLLTYLQGLVKQAEQKKSKGVQTLVKSGEFQAALLSTTQLLNKNIEHPKIQALVELIQKEFTYKQNAKIIVFTQFRETATNLNKNLNKIPGVKSKVFVGQAKKANTGLSQKEQKQIIDELNKGEINVICATSIAEEGLDIAEVSAVIFYEPIPSAIRKIQRAGRTARLAPGKLFILITKDTRDVGIHYAARAKEKRMHKLLEEVKQELKNNKDNNKIKTLNDFK